MHVGLWEDLRNPPAWRRPWGEVYRSALERIERAEALGVHAVWFSEHHFFEDGYLPQTMTFAAAVAARTSRIRIGSAVLLAPLRAALDTAEQAAIVDILSEGRLELGLGNGWRRREFEAYGKEIGDRFDRLESLGREIPELWRTGRATPPPVQEPVPMWIGAFGPRGARLAGRLGAGLLWLGAELLQPYREGLISAGHDPASARMAGGVNLVVADDPEEAWHAIAPHVAWQWKTYMDAGAESEEIPVVDGPLPDPDALRSAGPVMVPPAFDVVTAEEAVRRLRVWLAPVPAAHVFFWSSIAGMPEELVNRHVELLATEVAPAVADLGVRTDLPRRATPAK